MQARAPETTTQFDEPSCWARFTQHLQNGCYQLMAATCLWDCIIAGFRPGREYAINLLDIQPTDRVLLIGEGAGADFDCLPDGTDLQALRAFDYSPQMVRNAKERARELGIPEDNVFEGDAQALPFTDERFDKIFFPLSLGSIPDPQRALQEAERVLAPGGLIAVFEKMVDDNHSPSLSRQCAGFFAQCLFADINRNLTDMLGGEEESPFKITQYETMDGRLNGCFAGGVDSMYRVATLVRKVDFPDTPSTGARLA